MTKTADEHFIDWEGNAFGFGYGAGETYTIPAIRDFLLNCPPTGPYDYEHLEEACGSTAAWLLINVLCRHGVDVIEYGTSTRFGWLTEGGRRLREYMGSKSADELVELVTSATEDYTPCYPDACNCGPSGYEKGRVCDNPFWAKRP
ncbi:MAG: hypothetical protein RL328_2645 [Acidobacteriota bacterium]|jgi:hypothetical protein